MMESNKITEAVTQEMIVEVCGDFYKKGWFEEEDMELIIDDVIEIVLNGFRYEPRGDTEEERIPEDISTHIARSIFGVDAYEAADSN